MPQPYPPGVRGPFGPPQPPVKRKHTVRNLVIGSAVLLTVIGGCSAAMSGGTTDSTGTAAPSVTQPGQPKTEKPAEAQEPEAKPKPKPKPS